ncbi:MAG: hypothetical protein K9I84_13855 [Leadbetterella sp.]|jgi:hypothetical protein|nr:hypothetical protein [Leadbetterella sp.]
MKKKLPLGISLYFQCRVWSGEFRDLAPALFIFSEFHFLAFGKKSIAQFGNAFRNKP